MGLRSNSSSKALDAVEGNFKELQQSKSKSEFQKLEEFQTD